MPIARIISNYPIIAGAAERLLTAHYRVQRFTWDNHSSEKAETPNVVLLDVTGITGERVLEVVSQLPPQVRILIASLDRNEVDVYEIGNSGLAHQGELPSLLALGA